MNILLPVLERIQRTIDSPDFLEVFSDYLYGFLSSIYLIHTPYIWITSNLFARRISSGRKLNPSDSQDTENAAAYLPYVDYFVTDKALCILIRELELDKQYNTKVLSMMDIKALLLELRSLDKEL